MKKPVVYVVEMKQVGSGSTSTLWLPTVEIGLDRESAEIGKAYIAERNPDDDFRIRRYERVGTR